MRRRRGMGKYADHRVAQTFKIQITSMVDMFVILLVFLLKSYSTSPIQIQPRDGLHLAESTASADPDDVVKLIVSQDGVFVEENRVETLEEGKLKAGSTDTSDPQFIRALYKALDERAETARKIASVNEAFEFDGKILLQADRHLSYETLQKIMYTSMLAGYADIKLAVLSP